MVSRKYVEVGRVVQIRRGPNKDKSATIINIVDQNTVQVQNPEQNIARQIVNLKSVQLTDLVIKLARGASTATVRKAYKAQSVQKQFLGTSNATKIAIRQARSGSSDFERFQLRRVRRVRAALARKGTAAAAKGKPAAAAPKAAAVEAPKEAQKAASPKAEQKEQKPKGKK